MPKRAYTKKEQEEYDAWLKRQEELGLNADPEELEQWAKDHPELLPDDEEDEEEEEEETEETEPQPKPFSEYTEKEKEQFREEAEKDELRERKKALLEKLEKQIEESGKSDVEIAKLRKKLIEEISRFHSWQLVLDNPRWEEVLKTYFRIVHGMTRKMCSKTIITVEEKDGQMNFDYHFFDSNGKEIFTEFNEIYRDDETEEEEKT
jgi:hypothetical protein